MATVDTVNIKITGDTSPLVASLQTAESRVRGFANTARSTSGGLTQLETGFKNIGRTALAVALGMGGLNIAVTSVKAALEGTVTAAADDAASVARLTAAVDATGASYKTYEDRLDAVIEKGQQLAFSDDQTRSSLAILIAQTDSVAEATKRYAIAQDLARGANIDVVTASRLLGKITEENVTALQRYGISVRKGSTETEALAAVQRKFSGQAKAFADSTAGQFARTRDAISEAGESIGNVLLPAVESAAVGIAQAADEVNQLTTAFDAMGNKGSIFKDIALGVGLLAAAIAAVKLTQFAGELQQLIALQLALAKGMSTSAIATTLLGRALSNPLVAVGALTLAFAGLDLAVRHFTGGGLIDYLTGVTQAHRLAAAAAKSQGDAEEDLARLAKLGVTGTTAGTLELANIKERLRVAQEIERAAEATARAQLQPELRNADITKIRTLQPGRAVPIIRAQDVFDSEIAKAAENLRAVFAKGQISVQQFREAASDPIFGDRFKNDLDAIDKSLGDVAESATAAAEAIVSAGKDAQSAFSGATNDLTSLFDKLDPATEKLKLQKRELELLKVRLGDAFGDENQAKLDETSRRLELLTGRADEVGAHLSLAAANIRAEFADNLTEAANKTTELTAAILKIPEEKRIDVLLHLPDLEINRLLRFLAYIQKGFAIDVALRIASAPAKAVPNAQFLPGLGTPGTTVPGLEAQNQEAVAQALRDINFKRIQDEANNLTDSLGPLGDTAGSAAKETSYLEKVLQAASDGVIDLGEALQLGLTDQQVVTLELAVASNKAADAEFRHRIELQELAAVFPGLTSAQVEYRIGLAAIAQNMQETNRTAEQFDLAERLKPQLQQVESDFDALFNRPTRETAGLQLQLDTLQRNRLLRQQAGASDKDLKKIDEQIAAVQLQLDLRRKEIDIIRDKNTLADQTLLTDAALATQAGLLTTATGNLSEEVKKNTGVVFLQTLAQIRLKDAALSAADALGSIPSIQGRALGGPASGLTLVGERGPELVRLPRGSYVFPNGGESGASNYHITTYITADSNASDASMRRLAKMVAEEQRFNINRERLGGGSVNQNAFTPGGRR